MPTSIDPESIYPKRMGIYRGSLVIQYYNLQKDCFKKHVVPFDNSESVDKIIESILKNPKHSVFLRKVSPNNIKQVITGKSTDILPPDINERSSKPGLSAISSNEKFSLYNESRDSNQNGKRSQSSKQPEQNRSENISFLGPQSRASLKNDKGFKKKDYDQNDSYNLSTSKISKKSGNKHENHNIQDSYSMNFDEESMNISVVANKNAEKLVQEEEYYNEDFDQLSAEKIDIQKLKQKEREEREKQVERQMQREREEKQREKEKEKEKKKKKKKEKKQKIDDFEFLEQIDYDKKKKKDKSKEKKKQKEKSVINSSNPSKDTSVKEEVPIEEQFDFI